MSQQKPCAKKQAEKKPAGVLHGTRSARRAPRRVVRVRTAQGIILLLHHCAQCTNSPCSHWDKCWIGKLVLKHVKTCRKGSCGSPICCQCKMALAHFKYCTNEACPVCIPVKHLLKSTDCLETKLQSNSKVQDSGQEFK